MSRWFRFYDGVINDPKILKLSDSSFRTWVTFLCFASQNDGTLPSTNDVALVLRTKPERVAVWIAELVSAGLIDRREDGKFEPHNWGGRQYKSDVSTERVKRFRNKQRDVSETPPDNRDREQTQKTEGISACARFPMPNRYVFESGIIKLNEKDFSQWAEAFKNLDLQAELLSLSQWANEQGKNWFHAVKGALAKRNREMKIKMIPSANGTAALARDDSW